MIGAILKLKSDNAFEDLGDEDKEVLSVCERILDSMATSADDGHTEDKVSIVLSHNYQNKENANKIVARVKEIFSQDKSLVFFDVAYREGANLRVITRWEVPHG